MRTIFLYGLIPLAALTLFSLIKSLPGDQTGRDFRQLYSAGYMLRTGLGSQLYNEEVQRRVQQELFSGGAGDYIIFVRPAYEAVLLEPFSLLPYRTAYFCFLWFNIFLLGVSILVLASVPGRNAAHAAIVVLCFLPVSIALFAGQDSILLTLILAASCKALDRGHQLMAGIIAGVGLFKFQIAIPIFLLFVIWKCWKFCYGFVLSAIGVGALSLAITGIHQLRPYFRLLLEVDSNKAVQASLMANLHGLMLGSVSSVPQFLVIAAHLCLLSAVAIFLPRLQQSQHALLLAIPIAVLCSYYLFSHDLTLLLLPIAAVMFAPAINNIAWWSAMLLLLAPNAMATHLYLVTVPLIFFLLVFARMQQGSEFAVHL